MHPRLFSLLVNVSALAVIVLAFVFITNFQTPILSDPFSNPDSQTAAAGGSTSSASSSPAASSTATTTSSSAPAKPASGPIKNPSTSETEPLVEIVERPENPYSFAPLSYEAVNEAGRAALVNILCMPRQGSLRPISGSGVFIDSRGVILTNAHVAQYVLLSQSPFVDLSCYIRTGSPATAHWFARVLYIPPVWVKEHVSELTSSRPKGTGEHDYALLLVTRSVDGSPRPTQFPSVSPDTREGIAFLDDEILGASYPAEFLGGIAAQYNLYSVSSMTTVKQLLTFNVGTIDLISLGGVIEAQSGSSGGDVVNMWGRLVGIITTTSDGETTAERDLRALTLSYIDRDLKKQSGRNLFELLGPDLLSEADDFTRNTAPELLDLYLKEVQN